MSGVNLYTSSLSFTSHLITSTRFIVFHIFYYEYKETIVYPTQTAFFVKGGVILDEFICGTYTLKTENIPLENKQLLKKKQLLPNNHPQGN